MESGQLALVNYGEAPVVWHARLLLAPTTGSSWIILTPDYDRYEEQLDQFNPDYVGFEFLGDNPNIPGHIPAAAVYGFAPLDPAFLAGEVRQAKVEANAIRVSRGLPPLAPAGAPAAVGVVAPVAPLPPPQPPGVLGMAAPVVPAVAPMPPAAPGAAVPQTQVWVCVETAGGRKKGDIVCIDPAALPVGSVVLGNHGVVPDLLGGVDGCFVRKVNQQDAAGYQLDDLRILPIKFDAQGVRRRDFNGGVADMVEGTPQGGGLQLDGPTTSLNILKALRDQNFTPTTFHEYWLRSSEIPKGNRSVYEHEVLSRILESMVTVDQLNVCSLQAAELLVRRMQVIREAHRISPSNPDYSASDHMMGWRYKKGGQVIDAALAAHVATELQNEAAILKEARKAREEENNRRRGAGKNQAQSSGGDAK